MADPEPQQPPTEANAREVGTPAATEAEPPPVKLVSNPEWLDTIQGGGEPRETKKMVERPSDAQQ